MRARATAIRTLLVKATTAEVLRAFSAAGCRSILLKGPTLQDDLYEDGRPRAYRDTDLLVAPGDLHRAGELLATLGFELTLDHRDHPTVTEPHAQEWLRASDGQTVDLHWRLSGVEVAPERAWRVLSGRAQPILVGGAPGERPDRAATALLVALHAAHHGLTRGESLNDLQRAVDRFPPDAWTEAASLAAELGATEALTAGLGLAPEGARLADQLGLPAVASTRRRLMATDQAPGSLGALRIIEASSTRARLRAVRNELVPAPEIMRRKSRLARRGRASLVLSYLTRALARAWHLPRAIRALRASRNAS